MSELNFCPDCNNLLYAKQDNNRNQLKFICRQCDYHSWADPQSLKDNCVDRINYNFRSKEDIFVSPNMVKDPALGRTKAWHCRRCGCNEAIFFQLPERVTEDAMTLVFVCTNSGCNNWEKQSKEEDADMAEQDVFDDSLWSQPTTQLINSINGMNVHESTIGDYGDLFGEDETQ
ncbi:DNA-directed RNA polymerase II subunit I [Babesia microti strain RI]|uniref:DNA-directed RNA polymerase II subunit I n=1 Tax=Babesia microti (strain RI) TaxID=1133968 RepID=A0A1R4ABQ7_BABMR|nr:DNA-directed RNA polymerase II subunit I [Babesia microti strain RI]SJK86410.1 DNA-directed RNA polymerase II subunit I [Babesia microti strain RI]|eukprot:XP_021338571.1 DNA-directed RNA polymerase II subunit I [Babesia microti strain RI]